MRRYFILFLVFSRCRARDRVTTLDRSRVDKNLETGVHWHALCLRRLYGFALFHVYRLHPLGVLVCPSCLDHNRRHSITIDPP